MRAYNCGEVPALLLVISINFNCDGCKYLYNLQRWFAYFTNGGYEWLMVIAAPLSRCCIFIVKQDLVEWRFSMFQ
jgi:hypothetical protein